jgi:hypothetical protein
VLTRTTPDLPSPAVLQGSLQQQLASLAAEHNRLLDAVRSAFEDLNREGVLSIADAAIVASRGVQFPATQVASTDANNLDDFANNKSWTPVDVSGAALTLAAAEGRYTKIGDTVFAFGYVQYPVTVDGSNAKIGGLPFTVGNSNSARGGGNVSFTDEATLQWVIATNNTTEMQFVTAAGAIITNATLSGDRIYFLIVYPQA